MVTTKSVEKTCQDCGNQFTYDSSFWDDKEIMEIFKCPKCMGIARDRYHAERAEKAEASRMEDWERICPPLYRDTDMARLSLPVDILRKVIEWEPKSIGIGLAGESGAGKTRAMFLLLHKLHFAGRRVMVTSGKRFENYCHRMFEKNDEARSRIAEARSCEILFIDDIGKEKYTARVESEFYDLVETRAAFLRPILWTANSSGQKLVEMMGEDRGVPIVRRLREFTTILTV